RRKRLCADAGEDDHHRIRRRDEAGRMSTRLVVGTEDGETTVLMVLPEGGPPGPAGPEGPQRPPGLWIVNREGPRDAGTGRDGEFYIDTQAHEIYGPKTSGAWGSGTSLRGEDGANVNWQADEWDAGTAYEANDGVLYGNAAYVALVNTEAGDEP